MLHSMFFKRILRYCLFFYLFFSPLSFANTVDTPVVRVAVINNSALGNVGKLSLQLWVKVASEHQYHYVVSMVDTEAQGLNQLRQQKIDVLLAVPSPGEQFWGINFLNSYLDDSVVVVSNRSTSIWGIISPYLKVGYSTLVGVILSLILLVGICVWLAERKANPEQFSDDWYKGIGSGFWFALTTLTTLGYGDKVPKTLLGRTITGVWTILMFIAASSFTVIFTAALSSAKLSQKGITSLAELKTAKVGYGIGDQQTRSLAYHYSERPIAVNNINQALRLLANNKVTAIFIDDIDLRCYFKERPDEGEFSTNYKITFGSYAFAVREGSPLASEISQTLYFLNQRGKVKTLETSCGTNEFL
ncbi:MAG TPA: transporter substrate-binding domain-containing protein [Coxiellaceae bacterium]|nr:transporter substrate-binding domain-containing protein [Coxiellaceae bacterium]